MSPRRLPFVLVVAVCAALMSACGTGFSAETNQVYDPAAGSNHRDGDVMVLGALFVDNENGTATFSASLINKTDAPLTLQDAAVTDLDGAPLDAQQTGPIQLASDLLYASGLKSADIVLSGDFTAGQFVTIVLSFDDAEQVELNVPIVDRSAVFDAVQRAGGPAQTEDEQTEDGQTEEQQDGDGGH